MRNNGTDMSATDPLVAQKAYSTDLRYHERMARVIEGRGRILIMLAIVCLALAATRATDLMFFHGRYFNDLAADSAAIVRGHGPAPDQYRLLPHLLAASIAPLIGARAAWCLITFGGLSVFLVLLAFIAWPSRLIAEKAILCALMAFLYPLSMFAGPRFDTSLYLALMMGGLCLWNRPAAYLALVAVFSLARADYALILALFVLVQAIEQKRPAPVYLAAVSLPIAAQCALWVIFADAPPFVTDIPEWQANLRGEAMGMPGFWYALGVGLLVWTVAPRWKRPAGNWPFALAKLSAIGVFVLMMLVAARFSEGRLWLPLMPLVYGLFCGPALMGRTK